MLGRLEICCGVKLTGSSNLPLSVDWQMIGRAILLAQLLHEAFLLHWQLS
jgi:hypothetical protein